MPHQARAAGALLALPSGPLLQASSSLREFLGRFVVELDHHPVGIGDENLPDIDAWNLADIEWQALGGEPGLHAGEAAACEGDVMDHAGVGFLLLVCEISTT
jgi:hypothetical protein